MCVCCEYVVSYDGTIVQLNIGKRNTAEDREKETERKGERESERKKKKKKKDKRFLGDNGIVN